MFETIERDADERGQVGIGTLIVFIALVLVAAIAAGVLINTAGFLQNQAESTGQESTNQVSDRVTIQSVTGISTSASGDTDIQQLEVTVSLAPGADPVDLEDATYEYLATSSTTFDGTSGGSEEISGYNKLADSSGDQSLLEESDDTIVITVNINGNGDINNNLGAGDSADLTITSASGGTSTTELTVPDPSGISSGSTEAVRL